MGITAIKINFCCSCSDKNNRALTSKTGVPLQIIEFMFHAFSLNTYPLTALICTLFHTYQMYEESYSSRISAEIVLPRNKGGLYIYKYKYTYVYILLYIYGSRIGSSVGLASSTSYYWKWAIRVNSYNEGKRRGAKEETIIDKNLKSIPGEKEMWDSELTEDPRN